MKSKLIDVIMSQMQIKKLCVKSLKLKIQDTQNKTKWELYALLSRTHSDDIESVLFSAKKSLKTLSQYRLPYPCTCQLLLSKNLE